VAVSWGSKKQTSVALSSMEAKYIVASYTVKEAIWLWCLLTELRLNTSSPTPIHVDNQSTITITRDPEFYDRTNHIKVCYHFLQQVVKRGDIVLKYLPTGEQITDTLTKGLSREKHEGFDVQQSAQRRLKHPP
jgi:hypothetical protein